MTSQISNFCFTKNNYEKSDLEYFQSGIHEVLPIQYLTYGKEIGEKKTKHLQGYIELSKRVSFKKVQANMLGSHIESRRGTQKQAIDYCHKDGDVYESGERKSQGDRSDLLRIKQLLSDNPSIKGLLDNEDISIDSRSLRLAENLIKYYDKPRESKPLVLWFYGGTGTGKTRAAVAALPKGYFRGSSTGKWWPGYDGQTDVIIDDIRRDTFPFMQLLGILDRYPYQVEDKGTIRQFKGERIIITCPRRPEVEYAQRIFEHEDIDQLLRRIDGIIEF